MYDELANIRAKTHVKRKNFYIFFVWFYKYYISGYYNSSVWLMARPDNSSRLGNWAKALTMTKYQ